MFKRFRLNCFFLQIDW